MATQWWGKFPIEANQRLLWEIGPLRLWIERRATDWQVHTSNSGDPMATGNRVAVAEHEPPDPELEAQRLGFRSAPGEIHVTASTPDRPVVAKSETPYLVSPDEETTIYLSIPLWVQLRARPMGDVLVEYPAYRPSDTWFGENTLHGELSYATRTRALAELEGLPVRPHRAVCRVRIRNKADTPLPLERLRLPAPSLSLYADDDGRLWTEGITLLREEDGDLARVELAKDAPAEADRTRRVASPRRPLERSGLSVKSFGRLLGLRGAS